MDEKSKIEEGQKKDLILQLTVSKANYLQNAVQCASVPHTAPTMMLSRATKAMEAWEAAADLCDTYLNDLKNDDKEDNVKIISDKFIGSSDK